MIYTNIYHEKKGGNEKIDANIKKQGMIHNRKQEVETST